MGCRRCRDKTAKTTADAGLGACTAGPFLAKTWGRHAPGPSSRLCARTVRGERHRLHRQRHESGRARRSEQLQDPAAACELGPADDHLRQRRYAPTARPAKSEQLHQQSSFSGSGDHAHRDHHADRDRDRHHQRESARARRRRHLRLRRPGHRRRQLRQSGDQSPLSAVHHGRHPFGGVREREVRSRQSDAASGRLGHRWRQPFAPVLVARQLRRDDRDIRRSCGARGHDERRRRYGNGHGHQRRRRSHRRRQRDAERCGVHGYGGGARHVRERVRPLDAGPRHSRLFRRLLCPLSRRGRQRARRPWVRHRQRAGVDRRRGHRAGSCAAAAPPPAQRRGPGRALRARRVGRPSRGPAAAAIPRRLQDRSLRPESRLGAGTHRDAVSRRVRPARPAQV